MNKKNKTNLTIAIKKEIIELYDKKQYNQREIANKYAISPGAVNNILKQKDKITSCSNDNAKKIKKLSKTSEIEPILLKWIEYKRSCNFPLSGLLLQEKATCIAKELEIQNFKASNGWLESFIKRNNIKRKALTGETGFVDIKIVESFFNNTNNILSQYKQDDIYNCDETGLFYKSVSNKSFLLNADENKSFKIDKNRLTLLFCANSLGHKLQPLVIDKYNSPRALKNIKLENYQVIYKSNKSSWMTFEIFMDRLNDLNNEMKKKNRKILLILDNAPVHPKQIVFSNIELLFLPKSTKSVTQPLDQGIIRSFKSNYRKILMQKIIYSEETENFAMFLKKNYNFRCHSNDK